VLYGNNEDQHNRDPMIGFFPPSAAGYGSVHFGVRFPNGQVNFEGAVNDRGLAWDINSTPRFKLSGHPERPYYLGESNYLTAITKRAATVEDAIRMAAEYDFGDAMESQIHIADASGDAVVISAGPDAEVAFTRKAAGDGYHLSTNFNLAQPDKGPVDFRWETAGSMLDALAAGQSLTPAYATDILNAVHLRALTTYTLYSNVNDLKNKVIYLNYMARYDETAVIEMRKAFAKGERTVEMRTFFSPATAEAGDAAYRRFEVRFTLAKVGVIALGLALVAGCVFWVSRYVRRRARRAKTELDSQEGAGPSTVTG
jgi:hypothetical protein